MNLLPTCLIDRHGTKRWYLNGELHREDGPAIEFADGEKQWYINGHIHRLDGAAIIWGDGSKEWWVDGQLHRLDGPAIIRWDKTTEWWINDNPVTDIITNWAKENDIDLYNLSEDDKRLIRLVWFDYGK